MKILISIIVPIYNTEKYLDNCLKSILFSKDKEIEIILLNDGSTDNSEDICFKYKKLDKRIRYIKKENEGCSRTRNLGITLANGKYIWFIDGDDEIEKNSIKELKKFIFNSKTEYDMIVFGIDRIDLSKKTQKTNVNNSCKKEYIYAENFPNPVNKLYKKDIIVKNKIKFPENSHMGEDLAFNLKLINYIRETKFLKKNYYKYFLNENSVTFNLEKRIEIFKSFDDIFEFYLKKGIFEENKKMLKKLYKLHAIKYTYNAIINSKEFKQMIKKIDIEVKKRKEIFKSDFKLYRKFIYFKILIKKIIR